MRAYDRGMRYAPRSGYALAGQQRREGLRLQAAERFARGNGTDEIVHDLQVTEGSVRRWPLGSVSPEKLGPQQWTRLEPAQGRRCDGGARPGCTGFGLERFTDFVIRPTVAGKTARRELRLLIHASLDHRRVSP